MIQGIPALVASLGNLAVKIIDNTTLKDAVKKSANLLNWCYSEIRRLQQIAFNSIEREKQKDVIISELKQKLAKYENNG